MNEPVLPGQLWMVAFGHSVKFAVDVHHSTATNYAQDGDTFTIMPDITPPALKKHEHHRWHLVLMHGMLCCMWHMRLYHSRLIA